MVEVELFESSTGADTQKSSLRSGHQTLHRQILLELVSHTDTDQ